MKIVYTLMIAALLLGSCSGGDSNTVTYDTETDTSMRSIDSSAIINDTTRLPQDSTATGVQH